MNEQTMISDTALNHLKHTSPWVKFIAVLAFIGSVVMLLMGLIFLVIGVLAPADSRMPGGGFVAGGLIYLVITIFICLIPGALMMRYSNAISCIPDAGQEAVEDALMRQKSFWKYMGIYTIVLLSLYVLGILAAIAIPFIVYGASHHF